MRRALVLVLVGVAAVAAAGCGSSDDGWPSGDLKLRMAREAWAQQWPDDDACRLSSDEWADVVERNSTGDEEMDAAMLLVHFERCGES